MCFSHRGSLKYHKDVNACKQGKTEPSSGAAADVKPNTTLHLRYLKTLAGFEFSSTGEAGGGGGGALHAEDLLI